MVTGGHAETGHMNGHRKPQQKLDKPLKHIIFDPLGRISAGRG